MGIAIGQVPQGYGFGNAVCLPLPPKNGGGLPWGGEWLSFAADFVTGLELRVAIKDNGGTWRVETVTVGSDRRRDDCQVVLNDSDQQVSVCRQDTGADGGATAPVGYLVEVVLHG